MNRFRIEFTQHGPSLQADCNHPLTLLAPDIPTALVVAEINMGTGSAELWEGERHLAHIQRQPGTRSAYWRVG